MLDVCIQSFLPDALTQQTLKRLASRTACPARARSPGVSSPARPSTRRSTRSARSSRRACCSTLDYLGESVTSLAEADTATREYLQLIEAVDRAGIERNLSLKLTQLGLDVDTAHRVDNLRRILERGGAMRFLRPHRHGRIGLHRTRTLESSRPCGSSATTTPAWS